MSPVHQSQLLVTNIYKSQVISVKLVLFHHTSSASCAENGSGHMQNRGHILKFCWSVVSLAEDLTF